MQFAERDPPSNLHHNIKLWETSYNKDKRQMRTIFNNQFVLMQEKSAEEIILLVIQRIIQRKAREPTDAVNLEKKISRIPQEKISWVSRNKFGHKF